MSDLHFLRPLWLLALIPSGLIVAALWIYQGRISAWYKEFDRELLSKLWLEPPGKRPHLPLIMLAVGWLLTVLVLAGPVWEEKPESAWRTTASRILVLDLSPSMTATDVVPSRLERARFKIRDALEKSTEGRAGMVVFAGEAYIVTPLTEDMATIANLLGALSADIIPAPGNSGAPALLKAGALLRQAGLYHGDVLLLSDGVDDMSASLAAASELKAQGYRLSVLALVTLQSDADALRELALHGGGAFSLLTPGDHDLDNVLLELNQTSSMQEHSDTGITRWIERGVWLLPLLLLLGAAGFRRGWLSGALVILMLPPPAQALEWRDLWLRPDQQAADALANGQPAIAAQKFADPVWRGIALYQSGDYLSAAEAFAQSNDISAGYNRGNALAKAGQLEQAAEAYRDVLRKVPAHADAIANLALIEELLQQQRDQSPENTQSDEQSQASSQSDEDDIQQTHGDYEETADGRNNGEDSQAEETQALPEGGQDSNSEASPQDTGSSDQRLSSDQAHANDMERARQDVMNQDQLQENQLPAEQPAGEMDDTQPAEETDNETVLPSDQSNGNDVESAHPEIADQALQQDQQQENQMPAEQPVDETEELQSAEEINDETVLPSDQAYANDMEPARSGIMDQVQQQGQQESKIPAGQPTGEMDELQSANRIYDETESERDQWLQQIPDDPSGLLRRKFMHEHLRRQQEMK